MEPKNSPDLLLASHLAKPFLLPGQSGQPLSLRSLPDGGMVVIAADGRKMWFTALEVSRARRQLNQPAAARPAVPANGQVERLHEPDPHTKHLNARPVGKSRDGMSELIVLPESLKHLEERVDADSRKHDKPRAAGA